MKRTNGVLLTFLCCLVWSCGQKLDSRTENSREHKKDANDEDAAAEEPALLSSGPNYVLLDGKALESIYKEIFGNNWQVFSSGAHRILGTMNYRSKDAAGNLGVWQTTITREYIHILRNYLAIACKKQIDAGAMLTGENQGMPTAREISDLMSTFFNYEPMEGTLHEGAKDYATAFEQGAALAGGAPALADMRVSLCVAVGQDQRVYLK